LVNSIITSSNHHVSTFMSTTKLAIQWCKSSMTGTRLILRQFWATFVLPQQHYHKKFRQVCSS
jgi:hypothetical protein